MAGAGGTTHEGLSLHDGAARARPSPTVLPCSRQHRRRRSKQQWPGRPRLGGKGTATLHVEAFPFTPSLDTQMKKAHLVVSHAGSGSVFEALKLRKRLVVVVNDALMDNHQVQHTLYPSLWCVESHPSPVVFGARCRIDRRGGYTRTSGDVTLAAPSQRSRLQTLADIGIGGGRRRRS